MRDFKLGAHRWGRAGQARACPLATFDPEPCPQNADVTDLVPCKFGDRIRIAAVNMYRVPGITGEDALAKIMQPENDSRSA